MLKEWRWPVQRLLRGSPVMRRLAGRSLGTTAVVGDMVDSSSPVSSSSSYPFSSRVGFIPLAPDALQKTHIVDTIVASHRRQTDPDGSRTALFDRRANKTRVRPGSILAVESYNTPARSPSQASTFSGILIAVRRRGMDTAFTLRTILLGTGIEMRYSLYSNMIKSISVLYRASGRGDGQGQRTVRKATAGQAASSSAAVRRRPDGIRRFRRAKLYYLRHDPKRVAAIAAMLKKITSKKNV